jgi:hypothetical protein
MLILSTFFHLEGALNNNNIKPANPQKKQLFNGGVAA